MRDKISLRVGLWIAFIVCILFVFRAPYVGTFLEWADGGFLFDLWSLSSKFVQDNTRDFLIVMSVTIYFEFIRGRFFSVSELDLKNIARIIASDLDCLDVGSLASDAFSRRYKCTAAPDFNSLFFERLAFDRVTVNLRLEDHPSNVDVLLYSYSLSFQYSGDELVFAIARSPSVQDELANFSRISEVQVLSDAFLSSTPTQHLRSFSVSGAGGRLQTIKAIPINQYPAYVPKITSKPGKDFMLYECDTSQLKMPLTLEMKPISIPKNDPYIYWMADRLMYVECINVDISRLTNFPRPRLILSPRIMGYSSNSKGDLRSIGRTRLEIYSWISYGQGVILAWAGNLND